MANNGEPCAREYYVCLHIYVYIKFAHSVHVIYYIILNGYDAKYRPYNKQCENKIYENALDIHKHVQP